jgi:hypothetical protein
VNLLIVGKLLALKDLFQQLMNEMVHLKIILSHYNITNGGQDDNLEKPLNNQGIETFTGKSLLRMCLGGGGTPRIIFIF